MPLRSALHAAAEVDRQLGISSPARAALTRLVVPYADPVPYAPAHAHAQPVPYADPVPAHAQPVPTPSPSPSRRSSPILTANPVAAALTRYMRWRITPKGLAYLQELEEAAGKGKESQPTPRSEHAADEQPPPLPLVPVVVDVELAL